MKITFYLLVGLTFTSEIWASKSAAAWEALTFYYAYKVEFEASALARNPDSERAIAYGCSSNGRMCNFQQFLAFVYGSLNGRLGGYGNNGIFDPDDTSRYPQGGSTFASLSRMANDFAAEGFSDGVHYAEARLVRGAIAGVTRYSEIITTIVDRVQYARGTLPDGDNSPKFRAVRNALIGVYYEKYADDFHNHIDDIAARIKADTDIDVVIDHNAKTPTGSTFTSIDWDATGQALLNSGTREADLLERQKDIVEAIEAYQKGRTGRDAFHYRNVNTINFNSDRLLDKQCR